MGAQILCAALLFLLLGGHVSAEDVTNNGSKSDISSSGTTTHTLDISTLVTTVPPTENSTSVTHPSSTENSTSVTHPPSTENSTSVTHPHSTEDSTSVTHPPSTENSTTITPTPSSNTTSQHPSSSTSTEVTRASSSPTTTTQVQLAFFHLQFRIVNWNYTVSLQNESSSYYKWMYDQVTQMCNEVYGCPTCPTHDTYQGVKGITFSQGSIITNANVTFNSTSVTAQNLTDQLASKLNDSSINNFTLSDYNVSDQVMSIPATPTHSLDNSTPVTTVSSTEKRTTVTHTPSTENKTTITHTPSIENQTTVTHTPSIENKTTVTHTPSTNTTSQHPSSSTSTEVTRPSSSPTTTTQVQLTYFFLQFRILNKNYTVSLQDISSNDYKQMYDQVTQMCNMVYGCPTCPTRDTYQGIVGIIFSQGSIVTDAKLSFNSTSVTAQSLTDQLASKLNNDNTINGLRLSDYKVTSTVEPNPTSGPPVPGWGIALLVLACIILLLLLIFLLILIILTCQRRHHGNMDLFSSRGSFHPMSDYSTYHTHGRYMAPGSRDNPYNEISENGGNSKFSYTNPAMSSDNL